MMLRPSVALQNANDRPDSVSLFNGGWKPDTSIPWALTTMARPVFLWVGCCRPAPGLGGNGRSTLGAAARARDAAKLVSDLHPPATGCQRWRERGPSGAWCWGV